MQIEVDPTDVEEITADDRGRVTLGAELAGETVTVAIVDVQEDE